MGNVSRKIMYSMFFVRIVCCGALLISGCSKKDVSLSESDLYGTWIKGSNTGDTLRFLERNSQNLLSYNLSFNTAFFAPAEVEYSYKNNKLGIKNVLAAPGNFFTIQSFEWKQPGQEFKVLGIELFPFMNAGEAHFTYHKID